MRALAGMLMLCACSAPAAMPGAVDAPAAHGDADVHADGSAPLVDLDGDGLDDAYEQKLATDYLPYISLDPADGCALDGLLVRVRKHPADPTKILIVYDHMFQDDCGLGGHVGDDEVFGIAIDPAVPAPAGILAIKAASHQNTPCQRISECSTCGGGDPRHTCDLQASGGAMWPVLYPSKAKHGQYASMSSCSLFGTCLDTCTLAATPARPPITNAGEPGHPLTTNLTTHGFITTANGWVKPELMNFDPWSGQSFGGAGNVAADLVDDTFTAGICP